MSRFPPLAALVRVSLVRKFLLMLTALPLHVGCTETFEVLSREDAGVGMEWTTCEQALRMGSQGDRCQGFQDCAVTTASGCCAKLAACVEGMLKLQEKCREECPASCVVDGQCLSGREWCVDGRCTSCLPPPTGCLDDCPRGWLPRMRNGCYTCECVPPSTCYEDSACTTGLSCYAGASCAEGCPPGVPRCCEGNFCSMPGCATTSPTGCMMTGCPSGHTCVIKDCAPTSCRCDGVAGIWRCTSDCDGGVCVPVR
ncbi:hypothetical protein [Cystobacter ferrugineus]|uniref:Uncharacterized protein n=1 Tax=Cystobacter ferrugineus TaxID=83449 RepID=A0A1L9BF95_9BACT|nr:hypothetical protein [Cystobacter ferrugineus]OJH40878.1 hypothetical protein BON30_08115 [Cystobacter ferrugineus]